MRGVLGAIFEAGARIGADPTDDDELRLRKMSIVAFALAVMPAGLVWGGLYWLLNEPGAASIPLSYALISIGAIVLFGLTRNFGLFRFAQLLLILLLPALLMVALGGFVQSSAVILWSIISPMAAIVFDPRRAWRWFAAYGIVVALAWLLAGDLHSAHALAPEVILALFALNIIAVSMIAFALLMTYARQRQQALAVASVERERAESLLLNILPAPIAEILKRESRTIADHFDSASILFADVVDFTPISAQLPPDEVVGLLNHLFSHFDSLVDRYGLEKIKTIGDAYMVAAGIPVPRPDHAHALARLALDMQEAIASEAPVAGRRLQLRIGINSGPVVAGVIGRKRFIYDLWGDAVNIASRMESQGAAGRIQVTGATYDLIRDSFKFEPRGSVDVKGKGPMEAWYLVGPRVADVVAGAAVAG